ncbi:transcriptional regulator [Flexivirga endophytica]|uniref:Transcriptional regulator n=1 Tax=Flexivirga endophytica TaxID=1849103 RepID=A0A916T595_9MICO|nr:MerR family transcriptional regulator [Flexivirga endophytica]GGB31380.1 transcriptional regulator [Flexivirga endophytica]GHB52343.1 transcriptional regulator [Flexivirga endophytica]
MPDDATAELTLDQLVARSGLAARTIRFYTGRGMLPAPVKRGRSAYYTADHLARLELVRELQAHGFTLAAIESYLARLPADATPETIALHRTLLAPWMPDLPETLSRAELEARAGRALSTDDLDTLEALGTVQPEEHGRYRVAVAHLSVSVSILDLGLPPTAAAAAHAIFTAHGKAIAEELTDVFRELVWPAYKEAGVPADQLRETVERFKPLTIAALVTSYESAVNETKREAVARRTTGY